MNEDEPKSDVGYTDLVEVIASFNQGEVALEPQVMRTFLRQRREKISKGRESLSTGAVGHR